MHPRLDDQPRRHRHRLGRQDHQQQRPGNAKDLNKGAARDQLLASLMLVPAGSVSACDTRRSAPSTEELVVGGLYRYLRIPMYVGVGLVIAGQCLAFRSPSLVSTALPVRTPSATGCTKPTGVQDITFSPRPSTPRHP
jgi:Phospholipid methyltransferase